MTLPKPQRVRAFRPKTTTGCLTCKKRRVKCDEAWPACNRCTKLSIECAGYKPTRRADHGSSRPMLLPKHPSTDCPWTAAGDLQLLTMTRTPSHSPGASFSNQIDYAYFRFFREQSTRILSGPYQDGLWGRIVLQACYEEPFVRDLAASVAALELSVFSGSTVSRATQTHWPVNPPAASAAPDCHRLYALGQYGRALAGVRKLTESRRPGAARHALIAAILIYCFETICDGPEPAIIHFEKALSFLGTELERHGRPYRHLTTSSPTPDIEGELVAAFVRLDSGLLGRPASYRTSRAHRFLVNCDFSDVSLPPIFTSVGEARKYIDQVQFFCMTDLVRSWSEAMNADDLQLSDDVLSMARETSVRVGQWMDAFAPHFERALASHARGGPCTIEFALQIQALLTNLAAQIVWAAGNDAHKHHPIARDLAVDCNTINALSRIISTQPGFQKTFVWDTCILQGLITVITTAPNLEARVEAVDIVRNVVPRRESAWDSVAIAQTGEVVLEMGTNLNPFGKTKAERFQLFTEIWRRRNAWCVSAPENADQN